jgi:hypothetical protein
MDKRTMDELIFYFNQEVSKMEISQENKMKLLGMITAIGYENKKQEVVRCGECKYHMAETERTNPYCTKYHCMRADDWFCADGERKVQE